MSHPSIPSRTNEGSVQPWLAALWCLCVGGSVFPLATAEDLPPPTPVTTTEAPLPGAGLAAHDFFYAGESKDRRAFIIRGGAVAWSYDDPTGKGEISDAILYKNGDVLLAHQYAVKLVSADKKVLWEYVVPTGCEVHTAQLIGTEHVLLVQNGNPAVVKVINRTTQAVAKEFPLPVKNPDKVHGQFRHAQLTAAGTLLVAHMDLSQLCEYDSDGKQLWSFPTGTGLWGVVPLTNGNVLFTDRAGFHEVARSGTIVWECLRTDLPAYPLRNLQMAWRLPNGNTLVNNWANQWSGQADPTKPTIQALEIAPDKSVVWALRSWNEPNLGPATIIQMLDAAVDPTTVSFGSLH